MTDTAPDTLARVISYAAYRYREINQPHLALALGFTGIVIMANDFRLASADAERDLRDRMSKPHNDPDLRRACVTVLEMVGSE